MRKLFVGVVLTCAILGGASSAGAATIVVDTTADQAGGPACSLRNAVIAADQDVTAGGCSAGSGDDLIKVPAGVYELSLSGADENLGATGDLDVRGPGALTIEPASATGAVTIDGLNLDRVVHLAGGSLTLRNLTLTHGSSLGSADPYGGAIYVSAGTLNLDGVLVRDSRSQLGGGLYNGGAANLVNTTISGNRATEYGGGISVGAGSQTILRSVTVAFNHADSDATGDGDGGGLFAPTESVEMTNSILADNFDDSPTGNLNLPDCTAGPNFKPRFVISTQDLGCHLGADPGVSNQSPVDPLLMPLADNGGPTFTHALGTGSPAMNAGGTATPDRCPATDQRGLARPAGECDLGAYEFVPKPPDPDPDPDPEPLPGIKNPTNGTATFDGKNLHIRLKCPARFKPSCVSTAAPVSKRKGGKPMAAKKKVVTRANGWKVVTFTIKPAFRAQVTAMTFVDEKQLVTRQSIRSKRVGKRPAKRPGIVFHTYKVRAKA